MQDPTHEEMTAALSTAFQHEDQEDGCYRFDVEQAIYWFASDWHSGQSSNLYSVLSTSEYHPGAIENGCDPDSTAGDMYQHLVDTFGTQADKELREGAERLLKGEDE